MTETIEILNVLDIKGEIDKNIIMVIDFSISFSVFDGSSS